MNITSITYRKNFSVSNFIFETIGVEVLVTATDNPITILEQAKKWVESQNVPMESMMGTQVKDIEVEPKSKVSGFVEAINTSTSLKAVEIFRKLVERENIPELTEVFENKIKSFQYVDTNIS